MGGPNNQFEMSESHKEMFSNLTTLQKNMAVNTLAGMSPSDAHREAGGTCNNEENRRKLASEILTNPDVKEFIESMRQAAANDAVMSRQEMLERLSNLARVRMSDLIVWSKSTATSPDGDKVEQSTWSIKDSALSSEDCMASISEVVAGREGFKIKQHSPLIAMKQIAEMEGYNAPKKVELTAKEELTPWGAIEAGIDE